MFKHGNQSSYTAKTDNVPTPHPDLPRENSLVQTVERTDNPLQALHTTPLEAVVLHTIPLEVVAVDVGVEERTEMLQIMKQGVYQAL